MNVVSSADSGFYHCAFELAKSVRKFYGKPLILYDMGLTEQQKGAIDAQIVPMTVDLSWNTFASCTDGNFIQATHKPFCVEHYFQTISSEPMIFIDADCVFIQKVEETGFDIGVTLRSNRIDKTNPYNGLLNSGVIFFNTYSPEFLKRWADDCRKSNTTDQKALCDVLGETIDWERYNALYDWHGLKIKVFSTDEYNDYHLKGGKIYHFKGLRHEKDIFEKLIAALESGQNVHQLYRKLTAKKHNWLTRFFQIIRS